ncbi:hypothetical protein HPB52_002082 [Rhipicephalus sanguineus]|uniref:Uncharacterized protein n=1 Tax=Rhipicephalus sanguineus TaxID=34632 RepID=A0A9D4Q493_RHISA|nr:hypothetical protein HPB52_002082 [Rhipicephalus sanguineus]
MGRTPCDSESGLAVGDLREMIPSIQVTSTSGFEAHLDTVELWEHGRVDDVEGRAATSCGSFAAVEEWSTESAASTRGLSEMARAPLDAACSSYSDLQCQNWPPASSRSAWASLEKRSSGRTNAGWLGSCKSEYNALVWRVSQPSIACVLEGLLKEVKSKGPTEKAVRDKTG